MIELRVPSQLSCLQAMGQIAHNQAAHQHAWRFCGLLQHKNKWDKSPAPKSEVSSFCQAALFWKSVICRHRNLKPSKIRQLACNGGHRTGAKYMTFTYIYYILPPWSLICSVQLSNETVTQNQPSIKFPGVPLTTLEKEGMMSRLGPRAVNLLRSQKTMERILANLCSKYFL